MAVLDLNAIQNKAGINPPSSNLGGLISKTLPYIFGAAGLALLIYLILGGLQLMTSQGDPKAVQAAQAKISNALLGFVIVITAFLITGLLAKILGINAIIPIFGGSVPFGRMGPQ